MTPGVNEPASPYVRKSEADTEDSELARFAPCGNLFVVHHTRLRDFPKDLAHFGSTKGPQRLGGDMLS